MRVPSISGLTSSLLVASLTVLGIAACSGSNEVTPVGNNNGDGDGTSGDGDVSGDGDMTLGDGDMSAGDGDAVSGDGNMVVGDGDDTTTNRGFSGDIVGGGVRDGFNTIPLTIDGGEYNVLTNPWGGATQVITAGDGKVFEVTSITHPSGGTAWEVASFPSVYRGGNNQGVWTEDSGMPAQISGISAVSTGLSTNASSVTYDGNTTYDVYFTHSDQYTEGGPDIYLMVWFHSNALNPINGDGERWNCSGQAPTHIEACTTQGSVTVDGKVFHRFVGNNGHAEVISYAPEVTFDEWEFDLKQFIDDAVAQGVLNPDMYLVSVQAGFELADAGAGLTIHDYYVDVQ